MQSIDMDGLDRLLRDWDQLIQDFPSMKRELLEVVGHDLLERVRGQIGGTGTVQSWQDRYIGSKSGYVAIRPKANTYKETKRGERYAVGHVTNAIENGHKHRRPSQHRHRYKPRIKTPSVPGIHAYAQVRGKLDGIGREELEQLLREVARRLEGAG